MVTDTEVDACLRESSLLGAVEVEVADISGGCGSSFEVSRVVSAAFEGQSRLNRHKLVNAALAGLMKEIHALSIKKCQTPEEAAATTAAAEQT